MTCSGGWSQVRSGQVRSGRESTGDPGGSIGAALMTVEPCEASGSAQCSGDLESGVGN